MKANLPIEERDEGVSNLISSNEKQPSKAYPSISVTEEGIKTIFNNEQLLKRYDEIFVIYEGIEIDGNESIICLKVNPKSILSFVNTSLMSFGQNL